MALRAWLGYARGFPLWKWQPHESLMEGTVMFKGRFSKLYAQIIACFLCIIIFSGAVLAFTSIWFSKKNEQNFLSQVQAGVDAANERLSANVVSVFDLCSMVLSNTLVTENFHPASRLTTRNLYYYNSIIDLLRQSRLQFDGVVDSIFLYNDEQRVLYSMNERGMSGMETFFSSFMNYTVYDKTYWQSLLSESGARFIVLPADTYVTTRVRDEHEVIPLVYVNSSGGSPNVLVMNLSLSKMLNLFSASRPGALLAIYDEEGRLLAGGDGFPGISEMQDAPLVRLKAGAFYVTRAEQGTLNLRIFMLTPVSDFLNVSAYFRYTAIWLTVVFLICAIILAVVMSRRAYAPIREVRENITSLPDMNADPAKYLNNELAAIRNGIQQLASERENYKTRNHQHSYHYVTQGLATLLDGRPLNDETYFASILSQEYGFKKHGFRCADVLLDMDRKNDYLAQSELLRRLADKLITAFDDNAAVIHVHYQGNMLVLLIDSDGRDEENCRALLAEAAADFSADCSLRVGLGSVVNQLSDVPESFEQANSEVFALPCGQMTALCGETFAYDRSELLAAAGSRDLKQVEDAAEDILTSAKQYAVSYSEAAAIVQDIYKTVIDAQRRLSPDSIPTLPLDELNPMEVLLLSPEINMAPLLSALLHHIPYQSAHGEKSTEEIARRAREFLDEHYHEELSLDILADRLNVSAKYLSRIFKQIMGVNLSDYLVFVRVEKMKELLLTDLPLEKVAESVGIFNRTTFTRTFRKLEGVTPGEYRAAHRAPS